MIGLEAGTVKLNRYTKQWQRRFHTEARRLLDYTRPSKYVLEHIGSTAVPGLDAKPIIDMAMMIPSLARLPLWINRLESAGYTYKGEYGLPGRHFFTRGNPVTHHLHIVAAGSEHWSNWILFRDYLRAHPAEAGKYNGLKRKLAKKYSNSRDAYTKAKTPLVTALLKKAKLANTLVSSDFCFSSKKH